MKLKIRQRNKSVLHFDVKEGKVVNYVSNDALHKKAIIYCRVSSEGQVKDGHGLSSQEWICRSWCENNDVTVTEVFKDEWISGAKLNRPGLNEAINYLQDQNKKFKQIYYFVCTEESRISRSENLMDTLSLDGKIRATGADIVYSFWNIDTSTDEWKMLNQFKYIIASQERQRIAKRAHNGRIERIKQWFRPFKSVPVWYTKLKVNNKNTIILDEKKAGILKSWLEMYANDNLKSQRDLHQYRVNNGLTTNSEKSSGKLHFSFMATILNVPKLYFYSGYILMPTRWINEPIQGHHSPIISMNTVQQIFEKLSWRPKKSLKRQKKEMEVFTLKWIAKCDSCGATIQCWFSKNHQWKLYPYYGCCTRGCNHRANIPKDKFEVSFMRKIKTLTTPAEIITLREKRLLKVWEIRNKSFVKVRNQYHQRIHQIEKRQNDIIEYLPKISIQGIFDAMQNEWKMLEQEKAELQSKINQQECSLDTIYALNEKVKKILSDPLHFRLCLNEVQRKSFIKVRYWWELYHSLFKGFRTRGNTGLYQLFKQVTSDQFLHNTMDRSYFELFDHLFKPIPGDYSSIFDLLQQIFSSISQSYSDTITKQKWNTS